MEFLRVDYPASPRSPLELVRELVIIARGLPSQTVRIAEDPFVQVKAFDSHRLNELASFYIGAYDGVECKLNDILVRATRHSNPDSLVAAYSKAQSLIRGSSSLFYVGGVRCDLTVGP